MDGLMAAFLRRALEDSDDEGEGQGQGQQQQQGQQGQGQGEGEGLSGAAALLALLAAVSQSAGGMTAVSEEQLNEDDANAPEDLVEITACCREGDSEELKRVIGRIKERNGDDTLCDTVNMANRMGRTPLLITAALPTEGALECVKLLHRNGAELHRADVAGNTALHLALEQNNVKVAEFLLGEKCDANRPNRKNQLPAHLAAKGGHAEALQVLKRQRADLNCVDDDGDTPLHFACMTAQFDAVKTLLDCGVNIDQQNKQGFTPLFLACFEENIDVVKLLLGRGADLHHKDKNQRTPLHVASAKSEEVAKFLVSKGALCNVPDEKGFTPLHVCCLEGFSSLVDAMIKTPSGKQAVKMKDKEKRSVLLFACNRGRSDCARLLIQAGADVNETDDNNVTPVMHSVFSGSKECIEELINGGADIEVKDRVNGFTALLIAATNNEKDCLITLLKKGANYKVTSSKYMHNFYHVIAIKGNASLIKPFSDWVKKNVTNGEKEIKAMMVAGDTDGDTPLHLATQRKHVEVVTELMKYKPPLERRNGTGFTALHLAARQGSPEIAELLLSTSKPERIVSVAKPDGFQALHIAALNGFSDIVNILMRRKADVNARTLQGQTALMLACSRNHREVIQLLLTAKGTLKLEEKDKDGETALIFAMRAKEEDISIIEMLLDAGADILTQANDKECVLHYAVRGKRETTIRLLLDRAGPEKNPLLIDKAGSTGWTPLHLAAKAGETAIVELLLEYGARVDQPKEDGYTALHLAALNGQKDAVLMLITFGADMNLKNNDLKTARDLAVKERKNDVVSVLDKAASNPPEKRYPKKLKPRRASLMDKVIPSRRKSSVSSQSSQPSKLPPKTTEEKAQDVPLTRERRRSIEQGRAGRLSIHAVLDEAGTPQYASLFEKEGYERSQSWDHLDEAEMARWGIKPGHSKVIYTKMQVYRSKKAPADGSKSQRPGLARSGTGGSSRRQSVSKSEDNSSRRLVQPKRAHAFYIIDHDLDKAEDTATKLSAELLLGDGISFNTAEDWQEAMRDSYCVVIRINQEFIKAVDEDFQSVSFMQFHLACQIDPRFVIPVISDDDLLDPKRWGSFMFGTIMASKLQDNIIKGTPKQRLERLIKKIADCKKTIDDELDLPAFEPFEAFI